MESFPGAPVVPPALAGCQLPPRPALDVGHGGEALTGSRQDGDTDLGPIADLVEDGHHFFVELSVMPVHRRIVHVDQGDMISHPARYGLAIPASLRLLIRLEYGAARFFLQHRISGT